ncbi:MAG: hypothetical protein EPN56_08080 [Rhodanobacter sp.]|nr:MAG: hypothetical protein EPN78_07780 [Rhodanobacter sp.]TAM11056.1 MAG: hypothetical protein EPN66_08690 [Rhodanobacter sp.]TAM35545.1 MAG: hypothetical protein EPN56_08080 [Rhodanobacter sp.]
MSLSTRRWARFDFVKPGKVVSAQLDPERKLYLDAAKPDAGLTAKPEAAGFIPTGCRENHRQPATQHATSVLSRCGG